MHITTSNEMKKKYIETEEIKRGREKERLNSAHKLR